MHHRKLFIISICLLIFNLILGGLAIFQFIEKQEEIKKGQELEIQQQEILGATNVPIFNPNFIMSNETFSSTNAFPTEESVQRYLDSVNSPLRNYIAEGRRASYWIFAAARGQTSSKWGVVPQINPGVLLAYLEKEQSLLTLSNYDVYKDPENRIKTAMGYGCPDLAVCDSQYYGLVNQLNWAAYQLQFNYNHAQRQSNSVLPFVVNRTITTLDEYNIFLTNEATAANYRYTPHVYWGNYNLWKIIVANGWGVSTNTFSQAQIDQVNLANKDRILSDVEVFRNRSKINQEEGLNLVKRTYFLGQSGEDIANLQTFLRQEGYYMRREINGMYGMVTNTALLNYRRDKGIVAGKFKEEDRCRVLISKDYNLGDSSEEIKQLQQCLIDIKFFDWPVATGYYGNITKIGHEAARKALSLDKADKQIENSEKTRDQTCQKLAEQEWQMGMLSEEVRQLQECLRIAGFFDWPSNTGFFGSVTSQALERYRQNQGIVVKTTNLTSSSSETSSSLSSQSNSSRSSQSNSSTVQNSSSSKSAQSSSQRENNSQNGNQTCQNLYNRQWQFGTSSEEVRQLQECLRAAGFFNWPVSTGYFGPVTQEALARFRGTSVLSFTCAELKNQVWRMEETSVRVQQLQACMRKDGVFNWPHGDTGYFGTVTRDALIRWRGYF